MRSAKSSQRLVEVMAAEIDENSGTPIFVSGGQDFTITDTGVGDYLLTFSRVPPSRIMSVQVTPKAAAGDVIASVGAVSATSVQILLWDGTDGTTAKDADCYVSMVVSHAADEI
ncbi:hypothetical protein GOV11_04190 [Candidatus Woesearchaeota archaeon]|nr:hypothetical protein [Candidatus Woesearchaeota archaeon]